MSLYYAKDYKIADEILNILMISVTTIWIYHMWMKLKYERKPVKSLVLSTFAVLLFLKPT